MLDNSVQYFCWVRVHLQMPGVQATQSSIPVHPHETLDVQTPLVLAEELQELLLHIEHLN